MKLLKPTWVSHDGKPIFSIHIHPDGSKFATGGQGDDSGRVVIWNMAPVSNEKSEMDENVPKLLCQLDNHLACVNCVRWSYSGQYLASAGDDKLIMIWQLSRYAGGGSIFGGGGKSNAENWRCVSTLRGHSGDVLDLDWSPNDQYLASSSVDNTVRIWNMHNMSEVTVVLKGHTGLVKGVSWDPVGKYVASQSDDKTVRIWKTSDWKVETVVTEPFEECGGTTHVLRLSWSPDGQYLVTAHAMNGGGPTAQIVEREGWKTDKDFVGHRKAITSVSFNSNILRKPENNKSTSYCCCAIGSRDKKLSIWLTALKRPLVVIHDIFENSILDLSWSTSGYQLMACSWDGTVAYIEFTQEELGESLSLEEKDSLFQRMYGRSAFASNATSSGSFIVEDPEILRLQSTTAVPAPRANANKPRLHSDETKSNSSITLKGPTDKQIETRTQDGKRRITPVFIPPTDEGTGSQTASQTQQLTPSAVVTNAAAAETTASVAPPTFSSSSETRSKIVIEKRDEVTQPGLNSAAEKRDLVEAATKHRLDRDSERKASIAKRVKLASSDTTSSQVNFDRPVPISSQKTSQVAIPALTAPKNLTASGPAGYTLEVENSAFNVGHKTPVHRASYMFKGRAKWEHVLGSPITACAANQFVCVLTCMDGTLHCFGPGNGNRILPALKLDGSVARLILQDQQILTLTNKGGIQTWNIKQRSTIKTSLLSLVEETGVAVASCSLRQTGTPLVTLTNGKTYAYSTEFDSWFLLSDSQDPLRRGSDLQALENVPGGNGNSFLAQNPASQAMCTLSYAESKLVASLELGSSSEYRTWLLVKAKYMAQQGMEQNLRQLCDELLGPVHRSAQKGQWQSQIMDISKNDLLKEVLHVMASNLGLQRLCSEYNQQLNMLTQNSL